MAHPEVIMGEDCINSLFKSYIQGLLYSEIHRLEGEVERIKKENRSPYHSCMSAYMTRISMRGLSPTEVMKLSNENCSGYSRDPKESYRPLENTKDLYEIYYKELGEMKDCHTFINPWEATGRVG